MLKIEKEKTNIIGYKEAKKFITRNLKSKINNLQN